MANLSLGTKNRFGPGGSDGIAIDYGPDCPGSNPGGDEIFRPSRPALGHTQPPVQYVPGLSRGVKCGRGVLLTTQPRSCTSKATPYPHSGTHRACNGNTLPLCWYLVKREGRISNRSNCILSIYCTHGFRYDFQN